MSPRIAALFVLTFALTACDSSRRPNTPVEPVRDPASSSEQRRWYSNGQYLYGDGCLFVSPEGEGFPFDCGTILVGLVAGVSAADVGDLLVRVGGSVEADRSEEEPGWLVVDVPPRSERSAVLEILQDPRTRYAALNFVGPAEIF